MGGKIGEVSARVAQVAIVGERHRHVTGEPLLQAVHADQTITLGQRQRAQQQRVGDREESGVDAHPEAECERHRQREPRIQPDLPQREAQVLMQAAEPARDDGSLPAIPIVV